jgi:signal transduction histidine kinase
MVGTVLVPPHRTAVAAALPAAHPLATAPGARVDLLGVVRRPAAMLHGHADEIRDAATDLDSLAGELAAADPRAQTHVRSGAVAGASPACPGSGRMLAHVATADGMRVGQDDVLLVAALLLVGEGTSPGELAASFSALCPAARDPAGAGALLRRLSELGLARIARQDHEPHYVLTGLGEQHARATLAGQPGLAGGLADLEQLRTDLLSTVAHELRTPLTAVRTAIGLLLDHSVQPAPDLREQLLQTISQSAERMQRLVTDVLDLTRARLGGMQLQLRRFDAVGLAGEVAAPLRPLLDSRQQTLELDLPAGPVWVYGDHRRLEQALTNLLSNAHKFSPDGGLIRLAVARRGQDVAWTVADRGVGIPAEDRPRLFERFFSAATDAAGHRAGTGLGLPLALAIAQAHGGTIDVESTPGQGSTFTLRVPAAGPPGEDEA